MIFTSSVTSNLNDFDALWSQLQAQMENVSCGTKIGALLYLILPKSEKNVSSYYAHCLPRGINCTTVSNSAHKGKLVSL